jgi:hypothetical protein
MAACISSISRSLSMATMPAKSLSLLTPLLWHTPADKASAASPDGRFRANIPGRGRGHRIPGGRDAKFY